MKEEEEETEEEEEDVAEPVEHIESVQKLSDDLKKAAETMGKAEIRYLVDGYYAIQECRKALRSQLLQANNQGEPAKVLEYMGDQSETLERQIRGALDRWSANQKVGVWERSNTGVGPVISSGLLAHIDIKKAPTVGRIYSFAGLNPDSKWIGKKAAGVMAKDILSASPKKKVTAAHIAEAAKRMKRKVWSVEKACRNKEGNITAKSFAAGLAKRPYNADLQTLCWKLGDSIVKVYTLCTCGHVEKYHPEGSCMPPKKKDGSTVHCECEAFERKSFYGGFYVKRKEYEVANNEAGKFAGQAAKALEDKDIKDKATLACYKAGKLPPGRIDLRARRWVEKLFLSHLHTVMYFVEYGEPPKVPYSFAKGGHTHYIPPPNLEKFPVLAAALLKQYPESF